MKTRYQITFDIDLDYPTLTKDNKKMSKDFNKWLIEWAKMQNGHDAPIPVLFSTGADSEHQPSGTVRVKVVRDKETLLDTWWDELSDDF